MTPVDHIKRFPRARTSTLVHLIERERLHEQLRMEIAMQAEVVRWQCELAMELAMTEFGYVMETDAARSQEAA